MIAYLQHFNVYNARKVRFVDKYDNVRSEWPKSISSMLASQLAAIVKAQTIFGDKVPETVPVPFAVALIQSRVAAVRLEESKETGKKSSDPVFSLEDEKKKLGYNVSF